MGIFSTTTTFKPDSIPDLAGKVILVTGGNNGLGKENILQLAKHNPHKIFMAARTQAKALEAIKDIKTQLKVDVDIEHLPLDLASLPSIKAAAEQVNAKSARLDVLILNAGIMAVPAEKTEAGFDVQLGTNHVGHFLLTKLLLPKLEATAKTTGDVRVVSISSTAEGLAPGIDTIVSTEKLSKSSDWTRYGASKAANIMFAAELARRHPTITSVSLHPGLVVTDLHATSQQSSSLISVIMNRLAVPLISVDVPNGTLNQLWAGAGAQKENFTNGGFYHPVGNLKAGNKWASNKDWGRRLWDWTEEELKKVGY